MMLDRDVAAVAPSTTLRILKAAGLIGASTLKPSKKGSGFVQPLAPHAHWHIDFSYLKVGDTLTQEDLRGVVGQFITYYNQERLHSAIGFITPRDRLAGKHDQIHAERDKKLESARAARKLLRQQASPDPNLSAALVS